MLILLSILALLTLAASVLCLSAVGHLHTKVDALHPQITAAELHSEIQFQSRVTRRILIEKVLPAIGWRAPDSTEEQLNKAFAACAQIGKNKIPAIDAGHV